MNGLKLRLDVSDSAARLTRRLERLHTEAPAAAQGEDDQFENKSAHYSAHILPPATRTGSIAHKYAQTHKDRPSSAFG